jgi:hypothetical protein
MPQASLDSAWTEFDSNQTGAITRDEFEILATRYLLATGGKKRKKVARRRLEAAYSGAPETLFLALPVPIDVEPPL